MTYRGIGVGAVSTVKVCRGCRIEGFGQHRCYGEIVDVHAVGQASIHPCACAVERACAGHQTAVIYRPEGQP